MYPFNVPRGLKFSNYSYSYIYIAIIIIYRITTIKSVLSYIVGCIGTIILVAIANNKMYSYINFVLLKVRMCRTSKRIVYLIYELSSLVTYFDLATTVPCKAFKEKFSYTNSWFIREGSCFGPFWKKTRHSHDELVSPSSNRHWSN